MKSSPNLLNRALASALVFLEMNGVAILDPRQALLRAISRISDGRMNKKELGELLRRLPTEPKE